MACSPVGLISLVVKQLHPINRIGQDSNPRQALIFSGTFSTTWVVHLTAGIISSFIPVSYCSVFLVGRKSDPLVHANSSLDR